MSWLLRSAILLSFSAVRSSATRASDSTNSENRSLAFVFDTTASMRVDYEQFKNNVQNTMQYVWERTDSNVKHFVFVPFNDPGTRKNYTTRYFSIPGKIVLKFYPWFSSIIWYL